MYKIINSIFFLLFYMVAHSQLYTWNCQLLEKGTNKPAEAISVYIKGTNIACNSDENGKFSLIIPINYLQENATITIKNIAYEEVRIALDSNLLNTSKKIYLNSKSFVTCEINIAELKALSVVKRAVAALDSIYGLPNMKQHYYYMQTHKENGHYVRLIEAFLDIYGSKYAVNSQKILKDVYSIQTIARSNNFEQNDYVHGEHLNDLLLENYFNYPLGSALYMKNSAYFTYNFADTCDKINYYVYFDTKSSSNIVKTRGLITIDRKTFAIRQIEVDKYKNNKSENSSWKMLHAHLSIKTKEEKGKLYLQDLVLNYSHEVQNQQTKIYQWVVEELFELHWLENLGICKDWSKINNDNSSSLYTKHYSAQDFIDQKNKYQLNDYPAAIRKDLEMKKKLEQQWLENE